MFLICHKACIMSLALFRKASQERRSLMSPTKLDQIDRKILSLLQKRGRITNAELADQCHISPPPCLRRVRALEEAGYIRGYHANLSPELLGFAVTVFLQVKIDTHSEDELRRFEELVASWPEVRECHMLVGDYDFLLKVVARDWEDYQNFLTHSIMATPHVSQVKSSLALRASKFTPGVPLD